MTKEEFDIALLRVIMSDGFREYSGGFEYDFVPFGNSNLIREDGAYNYDDIHKYDKNIEAISKIIFTNEYSEIAQSISEEERFRQHLLTLSILKSKEPEGKLKAVLKKNTCARKILSKLNEGGNYFWDKLLHIFSDGGHGQKCLNSPQELEEFVSYINRANDKDRFLNNARSAFGQLIPAYSLVCLKNEEHCEDLIGALFNLTLTWKAKDAGLLNTDTIRLFEKAPEKASYISKLLIEILYTHKIYCPNATDNQNVEAKKELRAIIDVLHHFIKDADKIFDKCRKIGGQELIGKKQFLAIISTYASEEQNDKPSKLGMFRTIPIQDQAQSSVSDKMTGLNM